MPKKTKNPKTEPAPDHSARGHHPYSPSSLQMLEASPAFVSNNEESAASAAGTLQHEAVESGNFDDLTDEQIEKVETCRARKVTARLELAEAVGCKPEEIIEVVEEYLPVDNVVLKDGTKHTTAGFLDFALVSPCKRYAVIIDWKFGKWKVTEAENNLQGMAYMLGLHYRFPTLEAVHVEFLMPYLDYETSHVFEAGERAEQFSEIYARIRRVVEKAVAARMAKKSKCIARPLTCSFCSKIGTCQTAGDVFSSLSAKLNEKLELPSQLDPKLMEHPEEAAVAIRFARTAEVWAQALRRTLSNKALEDPAYIPNDYSLIVRNDRVLKDSKPIEEILVQMGATPEEIRAAYHIGISDLSKLIRKHSPRGEKDSTVEAVFKSAEQAGHIGREPDTKIYLQAKRKKLDD